MLQQLNLFERAQDSLANRRERRRAQRVNRPITPPANPTPTPTIAVVPKCVIEAIQTVNPAVNLDYLAQFDESALRLYLAHLESVRTPRGRGARWERPGDTRAIRVARAPEEI